MKISFRIDHWLLFPVVVLLLISFATLASISPLYFRSQLISLMVSLVVFVVMTQINFELLGFLKKPVYFLAIIILLIVLIIGFESRGAVRWIEIFGISIQFSELLKPLLSLVLAYYLAGIKYRPNFKTFLSILAYLLPVVLLIFYQPDLGNALIYAFVLLFTLIVLGFPLRWFIIFLLSLVLLMPLFWTRLHAYQQQRVLTFMNPHNDPLGTSYNSIQALIAIGSGMFSGKGLGESTQSGLRFLPERQTDFIFATLSEGMGFIGSLIVVIAFVLFFYRLYRIITYSENIFEKTFLISAFLFFLIQFFLNIGMNIGILPVVGVTLPFVSYGGSSLLANFMFLAIISSISCSIKKRNVLEIK